MDLSHEYNYNDPLELKEIFRDVKGNEYAGMISVCWEDIKSIEEYAHQDNWVKNVGEKFSILLTGQNPRLIMGNYDRMVQQWKEFRNRYPVFIDRDEED